MTPLQVVRLVARREIRERVRSRTFQLSSLLSVVVLGIIVLAVGAAGDDDTTTYELGVVGERADQVTDSVGDLVAGDTSVRGTVDRLSGPAEAERLVTDGDLDAALVEDGRVVVEDEPDGRLEALLQAAHREVAVVEALEEAGASPDHVTGALAPEPLAFDALDPGDDDEDRATLAFIGTLLLYGQLLGFGYWVATGIVEEKSSRVIELLLAKATPNQMLTGKVAGIGLVGFVQLVAFVAVGLGLAVAFGSIDLPPGTGSVATVVLAWFVLGYALYACLFAVGGAIASRPEELQATTMPISLVAMAAFFAAIFSTGEPAGILARVSTFVPPAAPLVLPIRIAANEVAAWEVAAGAVVVAATIAVLVPLTARIYAGGVLFTRGTLGLRDALARAER